MHALVTGGAGFIGSFLVERLLADGHRVTVLDDLSRGRRVNLAPAFAAHPTTLTLVVTDIRSPDAAATIEQAQPEVVFHLAAQIDVRASVADPGHDASVNVLGTITVAGAACRAGARKIVFASSGGSIYGDQPVLPTAEDAALHPRSPYAVAKVSAELYLLSFAQLHGVQVTSLAFANVYGPRQDADGEGGVVAVFSRSLRQGRPTRIYGDGGNTRDYVFVHDAVRALLLAAGDAADGLRINIGTGVQTTDRELHTLVARIVDAPDHPSFAPARRGDLRRSALDSRLAWERIGWTPEYDLADGVALTAAAHSAAAHGAAAHGAAAHGAAAHPD